VNLDAIRVVSQMNVHLTGHSSRTGTCELDSHADTLVAGANFVILEYTDTSCSVTPFCQSNESKQDIPIVKVATAYDDEATGVTYILILGQALYFGEEVESSLLYANQLRANGVIVDDTPVHLSHNQSSTHSIIFPEDNVSIPVKLNGCFSMIQTRTPSIQEIESCKWLVMTSDSPWDPNSDLFCENEQAAIIAEESMTDRDRALYSCVRSPLEYIITVYDIDAVDRSISSLQTLYHQSRMPAQELAKRWAIGELAAKKTLQVTTQKGVRSARYLVERRFRTKQAQLRYPQLSGWHGRFYTDTFFSSVPAIDSSTCCQLSALRCCTQ